jgi:nuclear pore complex protein Nup155
MKLPDFLTRSSLNVAMPAAFPSSHPVAALNYSTDNTGVAARHMPSAKPTPVNLPALQSAGRVLQDQFVKDAQIIPDLGDTLTARM